MNAVFIKSVRSSAESSSFAPQDRGSHNSCSSRHQLRPNCLNVTNIFHIAYNLQIRQTLGSSTRLTASVAWLSIKNVCSQADADKSGSLPERPTIIGCAPDTRMFMTSRLYVRVLEECVLSPPDGSCFLYPLSEVR